MNWIIVYNHSLLSHISRIAIISRMSNIILFDASWFMIIFYGFCGICTSDFRRTSSGIWSIKSDDRKLKVPSELCGPMQGLPTGQIRFTFKCKWLKQNRMKKQKKKGSKSFYVKYMRSIGGNCQSDANGLTFVMEFHWKWWTEERRAPTTNKIIMNCR